MNLLKNIQFTFGPTVTFEISSITSTGIKYLKENNLSKTYKGIKAFKSWIPDL